MASIHDFYVALESTWPVIRGRGGGVVLVYIMVSTKSGLLYPFCKTKKRQAISNTECGIKAKQVTQAQYRSSPRTACKY